MSDNATRERKAAATSARKLRHVAEQAARRDVNIDELGDRYNPRATMTQYRWKQVFEKGVKVWKLIPFTVSLSPSKQLNRARHNAEVSA